MVGSLKRGRFKELGGPEWWKVEVVRSLKRQEVEVAGNFEGVGCKDV